MKSSDSIVESLVKTRNPGELGLQPVGFALLLFIAIFAMFADVVLGDRTFYFRDYGVFAYPLAQYNRDCFWNGELPLWNPLNYCGIPHLAQWNTIVLYPGALLYLLLPMPWSPALFCLCHLFFGGMGMYFLARHWTRNPLAAACAGFLFAFNGLSINALMWPCNIAALAWLPWIFWLAQRGWKEGGRFLVWAACAGAMQMLAGSPEIILLTWAPLAVLWLADVWSASSGRGVMLARFVGIISLTTGLSAIQLLPFFDLLRASQRTDAFYGGFGSIPLWGWANLLVPVFRCHEADQGVFFQQGQYWTSSYYAGVGSLALGAWFVLKSRDRRVWVLAVMALVCGLLALGESGHVYGWVRAVFPPINLMRYPVKFMVPVIFIITLFFALGMDRWSRLPRETQMAEQKLTAMIAGVFLLLIGLILFVAWQYPKPYQNWEATLTNGLGRVGFLFAFLFGLLMFNRYKKNKSQAQWCGLFLLLILWVDCITHYPRQNPTVESWVYQPGIAENDQKKHSVLKAGVNRALLRPDAQDALDRIVQKVPAEECMSSRMSLYKNSNLIDAIPSVTGFYPMTLSHTEQLLKLLYFGPTNEPAGLLDLMGVASINAPGRFFSWISRSNSLPMVTAGQKPVYAKPDAVLAGLKSPGFDSAKVVFLEEELSASSELVQAATARITNYRYTPQKIEFEVAADQKAWVVVAQAFYPNWKAYVNGNPVPVRRANHAFQALLVPAGASKVQLRYEDRSFKAGAWLSLASLLVLLVLAWRAYGRPGNFKLDS